MAEVPHYAPLQAWNTGTRFTIAIPVNQRVPAQNSSNICGNASDNGQLQIKAKLGGKPSAVEYVITAPDGSQKAFLTKDGSLKTRFDDAQLS